MVTKGTVSAAALRKRAKDVASASAPLWKRLQEAGESRQEDREVILIITSQVTSNVLNAFADLLTTVDLEEMQNDLNSRHRRIGRYMNALRTAAARGDWDRHDQVLALGIEGFGEDDRNGQASSIPPERVGE